MILYHILFLFLLCGAVFLVKGAVILNNKIDDFFHKIIFNLCCKKVPILIYCVVCGEHKYNNLTVMKVGSQLENVCYKCLDLPEFSEFKINDNQPEG